MIYNWSNFINANLIISFTQQFYFISYLKLIHGYSMWPTPSNRINKIIKYQKCFACTGFVCLSTVWASMTDLNLFMLKNWFKLRWAHLNCYIEYDITVCYGLQVCTVFHIWNQIGNHAIRQCRCKELCLWLLRYVWNTWHGTYCKVRCK